MLEYLKIIKNELIDMFYTSAIIRKINNCNYKDYILEKVKKEFISGDTHHTALKKFLILLNLKG